MEVKKAMNHNELRSLQEAYLDVYEGSNVENVEELYKGKHGQSEKEYQDGRSDAGKMISGDSKGSGANYSYKAKNTGPNPAGGSKKPQGQARMGAKDREYLKYRKANLKKEEVSVYDIILSHLLDEGYAETPEAAESIMVNMSEEWRDCIVEADSLAAMAARRQKRLDRQRKQMGTSSTGQDFGHDYGISSAEREKRQQAEFDKFVGKKTKK